MREATARGPSIDISEFERRLRDTDAADKKKPGGDPLAELARLLREEEAAAQADPYGRVFAADRRRGVAEKPEEQAHAYDEVYHAADPRGSLADAVRATDHSHYGYASHAHDDADWVHDDSHDYLDYGDPDAAADYPDEDERPKGFFETLKSRLKPWHAVAGVAALGAASVGWGFAHRGGVTAPREIVTINAPEGPTKVQPTTGVEATAPQRGATVLDRNEAAPVRKVVSREEQPVDPTVAARVVRLGDGPVDAPHEAAGVGGAMIPLPTEPKKVKTVSVRPDGTVIERDAQAPAIARPAAAPPPRMAALGANPLAVGAPQATATPKSPARPATTPPAAQAPREKPAAERTAPVHAAAVGAGAAEGNAPSASNSAFAVQFGATGSEDEARQIVQKVTAKFGPQLGGRRPGYRLAQVGEKSVYRVRLGGMSREAAVGVCEKIKAAGGSCFVASN